ncbi:MAG: bifunctional DNA-formamidopyrimidine glycosylase/DNA-(apurinic or apyrimidinic site) lyase [Proteobacteria bacterium]|nr:bifunctional DNA-formamidopyrimidine glycosylase/DNA-(apurinic or apyrimidinic site) lyase [Pseudomonadota bacterium]
MPELPEVETTCRGIAPFIVGQKISAINVHETRLRWEVPTQLLKKKLVQQPIIGVTRRAKYIQIHVSTGILLIHLGMSGTLRITSPKEPLKKHDHLELGIAQSLVLRFNDPRRFGAVLFCEPEQTLLPLKHLGIEPLDKAFTGEYLFQKAHKHRKAIKTFIMDQHIVVGVGNIYANEALFLANVHPTKPANKLSLNQCNLLVSAIKKILKAAIKQGGTTLKDYHQSNGKPGYFSQKLAIYDREGLGCLKCGHLIKALRIAQRATYFCPYCQPL